MDKCKKIIKRPFFIGCFGGFISAMFGFSLTDYQWYIAFAPYVVISGLITK